MRRVLEITVLTFMTAVFLVTPLACGDNGDDGDPDDGMEINVVVRGEIASALATDKKLEVDAMDIIEKVKANQYDLRKALDDLVDQTRVLTSLIVEVAAPKEPPDANLAEAQDLAEEYLRNRVHQLELALSAQSGEELEPLYLTNKAELDAARDRVGELLNIPRATRHRTQGDLPDSGMSQAAFHEAVRDRPWRT